MKNCSSKDLGKTKYKGVSRFRDRNGKEVFYYSLMIKGTRYKGYSSDEKECAKQYDLKLIENGRQPVNILKPKQVQP